MGVLRRTGQGLRYCKRMPKWFAVWFVVALGLFCPDSYRQVFRWLHRFKKGLTPGRSTLCEARKSIGVAPIRRQRRVPFDLRITRFEHRIKSRGILLIVVPHHKPMGQLHIFSVHQKVESLLADPGGLSAHSTK